MRRRRGCGELASRKESGRDATVSLPPITPVAATLTTAVAVEAPFAIVTEKTAGRCARLLEKLSGLRVLRWLLLL